MGAFFSFLNDCCSSPMKIMMLGLDGAGKTSILHRLKFGDFFRSVPTEGFNVETLRCGNLKFAIWDIGGGDKYRRLYQNYYTENLQAIIWVIDSTDQKRFMESKSELDSIFSYESAKGVRLLVFNTKSDMENSKPSSEVADDLILTNMDREWCIVTCSSKTGAGISEGMEKLVLSISEGKPLNGDIY